ncbi:short-chain dehydrogenase/reductase, partial [Paraphaeosphaeria sporulosa]
RPVLRRRPQPGPAACSPSHAAQCWYLHRPLSASIAQSPAAPHRLRADRSIQASLAPHSLTARPTLAFHTCDTQAARGSGLQFDSLLPSGVAMAAIRGLVLAGALIALSTAPSSYGAPTLLPLSSARSMLLARVLKWVLAGCLVLEINSLLNAWAENRWMLTNDKSSWQWDKEFAVVTGGSHGIGAAVVNQLTSHGVKVAVLDIQPLSEAVQNDGSLVSFYQCDLTSRDAVHEAAAALRSDHGSPSILINNAGIGLNLVSHWYTVQEFLPDMIAKKKGHVMATSSMAGFVGLAGGGDYAATKAGLIAFHESLTQELKHRYKCPQIKTSIVYPYWTRTRLNATIQKRLGGMLKEPEDIAKIMVDHIIAAKSGQLVLGPKLAPLLRGTPIWLQELVRDSQAHIVTGDATSAVLKNEVLGKRDSLTARRYNRLNRRQQPWSNQTTVPEVPETQEPEVPESPTSVVVVSTSDDLPATSASQDEVSTTSEAPTTTEALLTETPQQTAAIPTTSSRSRKPAAKQPEPTSIEDNGPETATSQELPTLEPTLSKTISSTEAITTDPSSSVIPESTEVPVSVTSSAVPSTAEAAVSSEASSSLEPSTTAAPISTTSAEASDTSTSAIPETTEDVTTVRSSTEPSTSEANSEVPQSTSEDPTLTGSIETPTPSHTRSRHSESVATPEPTVTTVPTSSGAENATSAEETVTPSSTLTQETTESEIEIPTRSRTQSEKASEASQTEEPTTTSFEAAVTSRSKASTDVPETTAAPSLPDLLPISSIISDVEDVSSAIESVASSVKSDVNNVPSAISSVLSSVKSDVNAIPTEINSIVSSVVSSVKSGVDALPTDVSDIISSVKSDVDTLPTGVSSAISSIVSEVLTSVKPVEPTVPASETASDIPTTSTDVPALSSTGDGVSLPGASGTAATPTPSATPTGGSVSSTDGADSTFIPTADPTSVGVSDATTTPPLSAPLDSDLPSLSLFDPSATPTSASTEPSDLASTDVPTSETKVSPTATDPPTTSVGKTSAIETSVPASETSVIGVPSGTVEPTLAPVNETSAAISSGSSDAATLVPTSGLGVSMTSGSAIPTEVTSSASIAHPTDPALAASTVSTAVKVDTLESQVPIDAPVPTSESTTNPETSMSSVEQSPTSPTEAIPTVTDEATSQASSDPASETDVPSDDPTDSPSDEVPTETSAQLGPPPTVPTGFDSADPAARPSASSTEAPLGGAGGEEKPPPLSKSQTAGIAVGGTTCLLIALVAALFLARRYHSNMSNKRNSIGDDYSEKAYYNSPTEGNGGHDAEAGGAVSTAPTMSGAAGGALSRSLSSASVYGPAPQGAAAGGLARSLSKASSHRHSIGHMYTAREQTSSPAPLPRESRYSTGSYLSTGPWDPSLALNAAAAASSVSLNQYKDEAAQNPFRDPEEPKPVANPPPMGGTVKGPLTINPYAFNAFNNTPAAREYPPMSPYGLARAANRSSSPVRARASERQSDPFADPFEHDLILNVDMRTATESSITVLAPPPTPRSGGQAPSRGPSPNPYEFRPPPAPFGSHFPGRDSDSDSLIPEPLTLSGRNTPEGRQSPMPRESPDSQRTLVQPPPAHVGPAPNADNNWGNKGINHPDWSNPDDVPRPLFPKKPLPLRRQPTLAGPGQTLLASTGLPLTIKRKPMGNDSVSGVLDVPRNQHLSPSPSPSQTDFSDDPTVQRKRSGEMMFADPALVGRAQF